MSKGSGDSIGHERFERRVELRALGLARRGDRASGGQGLLRRARRRLFRASRRNADPAARPGIFDLFDRGGHAAARRQAAGDPSQRLDDQRQRSGVPGSQLSEPPAHQAHGAQALPPQRDDRNACRRPRASHERRRDLRACAGLRDLPRHPRRLAARRRPWGRSIAPRRSTISSPPSTPASSPSIAPTSIPGSRSFTERCARAFWRRAGSRRRAGFGFTPNSCRTSTFCTRIDRRDVAAVIDRSLRRLRAEALDLVQFHWWDYSEPRWLEAFRALDDLRRDGKVRHIGATNFDARHLRQILDGRHPARLDAGAIFAHRPSRPEHGLAALCEGHGVGLLCYGSVAGGFLSDRLARRRGAGRPARQSVAHEIQAHHRRVRRLAAVSGALGGAAPDRRPASASMWRPSPAPRFSADPASPPSSSARRRARISARTPRSPRSGSLPPTMPKSPPSRRGASAREAMSMSSSATAAAGTARS